MIHYQQLDNFSIQKLYKAIPSFAKHVSFIFLRRFCKVMPGIAEFGTRGLCYYAYSSLICCLGILVFEGLQPVVQQSTICPAGSGALRSQTWLRKIDARSCVDIISYQLLDATSWVDFTKPCLAWQSS